MKNNLLYPKYSLYLQTIVLKITIMNRIACVEDIDRRIKEIWDKLYMKELPSWVSGRRYRYADHLVTYLEQMQSSIVYNMGIDDEIIIQSVFQDFFRRS